MVGSSWARIHDVSLRQRHVRTATVMATPTFPSCLPEVRDLGLKHGSHLDFNRKAKDFEGYSTG